MLRGIGARLCFGEYGMEAFWSVVGELRPRVVVDAVMSSYDSLDIVFRCLSKGAADYLVKPVRKNELRNLWQHVWRKCHSVSARFGLVACFGYWVRLSALMRCVLAAALW